MQEDNIVTNEKAKLLELVQNDGWVVAKKIISDQILDLQNAFNIEGENEHDMFVDLRARKIASKILFDFLRELEGTKEQTNDSTPTPPVKSYLLNNEL